MVIYSLVEILACSQTQRVCVPARICPKGGDFKVTFSAPGLHSHLITEHHHANGIISSASLQCLFFLLPVCSTQMQHFFLFIS